MRKTKSFSDKDMRGEAAMVNPRKVGGLHRTPSPKSASQGAGRQENDPNDATG